MKRFIVNSLMVAAFALTTMSCKDDLIYSELVRDNRPAVPVTFPGTTAFGFDPFISTSISGGGAIKFTLSIPAESGRTIKEITRVVGGTSAINIGTLNTASQAFNTAPIAGAGTTATFETTLAAFRTRYPTVPVAATTNPLAPNEIAFLFLVTLDDNTQIVTQRVRVRLQA